MRFPPTARMLCSIALTLLCGVSQTRAAAPTTPVAEHPWPSSLTAKVGDVSIRIDGGLLCATLGRVEYKGALMGVEGSVCATVMTYPGKAQHLGVAHVIEVPGHPGEYEREKIKSVQFELDGRPLRTLDDLMTVSGKSFRMERISQIRSFALDSKLKLENGVLVQWVRIQTPMAVQLETMFPLALPWNTTMTEFEFGKRDGTTKDGKFNVATTKPSEGLEKDARWVAVYDPVGGKGAVTYLVTSPKNADAWFQYTDAPTAYRKQRLMSFVEKTVPAGFDGTYCEATGFFTALPDGWRTAARACAAEIKNSATVLNEP